MSFGRRITGIKKEREKEKAEELLGCYAGILFIGKPAIQEPLLKRRKRQKCLVWNGQGGLCEWENQ